MLSTKDIAIKELRQIPGVGKTIANDLWDIGFKSIVDLKGQGATQDRCMLYVFRCAVYYANTNPKKRHPYKLMWWNWKDK
jgi:Pathogenicity locus